MKKLVIAAFAVMVGVAAQAAASHWNYSIRNVIDVDNVANTTYTGGPVTLWASIAGQDDWFEVTEGAQNISAGKLPTGVWDAADGVFDSTKLYDFYFTIVDTNSKDQTVTYTSKIAANNSVTTGAGQTTITFGNVATDASNVWVSNIPEPTSGLLLLLGVAGLALRRRRA